METIKKQKSHAFGKNVYLLGVNEHGEKMWLEEAKWDCDWYWGFGYIETYQQNLSPEKARDISSHTHWDSAITGKQEKYNAEKQAFLPTEYHHKFNDHKEFKATTLTDKEDWTLSELMKTAYILKATAELYHMGSAHISENPCNSLIKNKEQEDHINKVLLPAIFQEIYKALSPKDKD